MQSVHNEMFHSCLPPKLFRFKFHRSGDNGFIKWFNVIWAGNNCHQTSKDVFISFPYKNYTFAALTYLLSSKCAFINKKKLFSLFMHG